VSQILPYIQPFYINYAIPSLVSQKDAPIGSVRAQMVFDWIWKHPYWTAPMPATLTGGQCAEGIVYDLTNHPVAGDTVDFPPTAETATTNSDGTYIQPAIYTDLSVALTAHSDNTVSVLTKFQFQRLVVAGSIPLPSGLSPWIAADTFGGFHLAVLDSAHNVKYFRSENSVYPGAWTVSGTVTTFGDVVSVAMEIDAATARIWMAIVRSPSAGTYNTWVGYSDDDGVSFGNWSLTMAGARGATVWTDYWGGIGVTWFVYNSGSSGPGTQQAIYKGPGDAAFSSPWTFKDNANTNLAINDGGWCNVEQAHDAQDRLTYSPVISGNTSPTNYWSVDGGKTWVAT
jgi:hypothetical protein